MTLVKILSQCTAVASSHLRQLFQEYMHAWWNMASRQEASKGFGLVPSGPLATYYYQEIWGSEKRSQCISQPLGRILISIEEGGHTNESKDHPSKTLH